MTRTHAFVIAGLLVVAGSGVARAAEAEADALVARGVEQRLQGNPAKALELFEKAYELSPSGRVLVHRGSAEAALRKWAQAERHLSEALMRRDSPWLENEVNREMVQKTLASVRLHVGSVRVEGTDGADISLDGEPVGRLPLAAPLRASEGKVRVAATAAGRRAGSEEVTVVAGKEIVVRFDLAPSTPPAPATPPPAVVTPPPAVVTPPPAVVTPPAGTAPSAAATSAPAAPQVARLSTPPAGDGGGLGRGLAWASAIAGGAALAGGIVETIVWQQKRGQFNDTSHNCFEDLPMRGPGANCSALYDDAQRAQTFAIVGYALAAALGTTSTLLFLSAPAPETAPPWVACAPALPSAMVNCRLTF